MTFIVQKRDYDQQMNNLFYHSLMKIIVLHHLDQVGISWDTSIANDIFTAPQAPHAENVPSSSHPATSMPPPQSTSHTPSPSPPLSPFYEQDESPSRGEVSKPKEGEICMLAKTYYRGYRQVFSPNILGGALPFSPIKQVQKGKQNMAEEDVHEEAIHEEDDLHERETYFDLVDLDEQHDDEAS